MAKVVLFSNDLAEAREFDHKHAERILKYQENKNKLPKNGWALPEDSNLKYVNGKLITGADKGTDKKPQK